MQFETVIGLEVHVHLATESKLFCPCPTTFGVEPNENVCEVCSGMPGVLPVLNARAVEFAARLGFALDCAVNNDSIFARKNYFYPDLPKGYQISQFERPICGPGHLIIHTSGVPKSIGITRIHLEDDAGKNIHTGNSSYVDLNRAGVPLVEIVSEPDMRSAEEAVAYLKALHAIVVHLGVSDGNMEEGSFRCDANVSIRPFGQSAFGTRAELKNLNSFRHVQKAIEYEVQRQKEVIEDGGVVIQETRLFDSTKNITLSMRSKEEAQDYRYFPDPDLIPVHIASDDLARWRASLPELPEARRTRFISQYALPEADADAIIADPALTHFFEQAVLTAPTLPRLLSNLVMGPLLRELNQSTRPITDYPMTPAHFAELARIIDSGLISSKIAHDIFADILLFGVAPERYVTEKNLVQVSDVSAIEQAAAEAIAENPAEVEAYKGGKVKLLAFFVGQVMRRMKGKANPAVVNEVVGRLLG